MHRKTVRLNIYLKRMRGKYVKSKILVVGSLNMDISIRMGKIPVVGETVLGDSLLFTPGGKGANQACAAGKLGGDIAMLGCVGGDDFGRIQRKSLREAGVDVSRLKTTMVQPTGTAVILVDAEGNNDIVVVPGANRECDVEYIRENDSLIRASSILLVQMEIPWETIAFCIRRACELGRRVILNPAPAPESLPDDILKMVDFITPNETELEKLSGLPTRTTEEIRKAAQRLLARGARNVLVTIGKRGVLLANGEGTAIYPTTDLRPVDTTGAGDTLNGAFMVALSEGKTVEEAIRFGNAASSISVTRKGAQESIPLRGEVDNLLRTFRPEPVRLGPPDEAGQQAIPVYRENMNEEKG